MSAQLFRVLVGRRTWSYLSNNGFQRSTQFTSLLSHSRHHFVSATPQRTLNDIDHDDLIIELTSNPKPKKAPEKLQFGADFSDHMLEIDWTAKHGWSAPKIKPYGPFTLEPSCSIFHYALEAFEGMKAYLDDDDNIRLFRPKHNIRRMLDSCDALFFPAFDPEEFLKCLHDLVRLEKEWIPKKHGYSLYIRPTIISTFPFLGLAPAEKVKLFVIMSPVGAYHNEGFHPISLHADTNHIRAWPKGTGDKKLGGNYGPTIKAHRHAVDHGYSQVLWLFGEDDCMTEAGTMNIFVFWINENGERELITPPLDGTILPGVTRASVLQLSRQMDAFEVTERHFHMSEFVKASKENRIIEVFGAGTAAIIAPINGIGYHGRDYRIPLDPKDPSGTAGWLARKLHKQLTDIQYGRVEHDWSVVVPPKDIGETRERNPCFAFF